MSAADPLLALLVLAIAGGAARAFAMRRRPRAAVAERPEVHLRAAPAPEPAREVTFGAGEPPASAPASLVLAISRSEIEELDVGPAVLGLRRWQTTPGAAWESRARVRISLRGYAQDSRELHEIDEVRDYFTGLLLAFPPWFFFADPNGDSLRLLALCTCRVRGEVSRPRIHADDLQPFMRGQLQSLRTYAEDLRVPLGVTEEMGRTALRSLEPLLSRS